MIVTTTTAKLTEAPSVAPSSPYIKNFIINFNTDLCLGSRNPPEIDVSIMAEDCETARAEYFMHIAGKLVPSFLPNLCIAKEKNASKVTFKKCMTRKSRHQDWVYNKSGLFNYL